MALSFGLRRAIWARKARHHLAGGHLARSDLARQIARAGEAQRVGGYIHLAFLKRYTRYRSISDHRRERAGYPYAHCSSGMLAKFIP